jgi:hypothetical protein
MPMKFSFTGPNSAFSCNLQCNTCTAQTKGNVQCKKRSCIGAPLCWIHLLKDKHLRIKASGLRIAGVNPGKGLWVIDKGSAPNATIYRTGDEIIAYFGQIIDEDILNERYDQNTAPYALRHFLNGNIYEDGACKRGTGTMINQARTRAGANVRFKIKRPRGAENYAMITATKNIKNNKELFLWYGNEFQFNEPGVVYKTK